MSFEFAEVPKTQEEYDDLAFEPEHIPPTPSGFPRFRRRKIVIIMIRYLKSKTKIVMLLPCDFEENPSCFEDTCLIKTILPTMKMLISISGVHTFISLTQKSNSVVYELGLCTGKSP